MTSAADQQLEHLDVVVVGAGVSGIGAARYLRQAHPQRSLAVLEGRGASGGTWDLFRYPGIRSDSDLHTFGYSFKPWRDKQAIADGPRILDYVRETARENGVEEHIRYHRKVVAARWSTADARWVLDLEHTDTGERSRLATSWLFMGSGYYRYDEGFRPEFPGEEQYAGTLVHPQHWPEDLEVAGKRFVIIGSGATAVTLVPALVEQGAASVTMLQRTPSYIMPMPREDAIANWLVKRLGRERGYALTRRKNIRQQRLLWLFCQRFPGRARKLIRSLNAKQLPADYPVDEHFNPPYDPWDQRLCLVPDADLFKVLRDGRAEVVTDTIETFTEHGVRVASGRELEADVIVTATGLNLQLFGGMTLEVDGREVALPDTVVHRGTMLSGIPNFNMAIGYTNASWTLKVDLVCDYWVRLLAHMDATGADVVRPVVPEGLETRPVLDFQAGYVKRSLHTLPRQGPEAPWVMSMSWYDDRKTLRQPLDDPSLVYSTPADRAARGAGEPEVDEGRVPA